MLHFQESSKPEENYLEYLPFHVLCLIFGYLDLRSVVALSSVSRTLNRVIKNDYLNIKSSSLLVTNQFSTEIKDRFRPWLQLGSRYLFVSQGSDILCYERNTSGIFRKPCIVFKGHDEDVVRFVVKDDVMISGGDDGKICFWKTEKGRALFSITNPIRWSEDLYVDFCQTTVAAGFSHLGEVNFWSIKDEKFTFKTKIELNERLRSISLSKDAVLCALGSCGYQSFPLKILDTNRGLYINLSGDFKDGAGIYDIIWETPQTLLSGGFDSMLHLWDIRLGGYVRSWSDPYDAAIYTLATDYHFTMMTGSALHSRITLWDKRHSSSVQDYFVSDSMSSGPVYSFDFDPTFMFVALDTSLHVMDFSRCDKSAQAQPMIKLGGKN